MTKPYNFSGDSKLPPALAALMQSAADRRAAQGFISPDGQTHLSAECRDLYDGGCGLLHPAYLNAADRAKLKA